MLDLCWHTGVFLTGMPWKVDVVESFSPLIMLMHGRKMR